MKEPQKIKRTAGRMVSVFLLIFMLVVSANAYTVVMRGGRRIEIPSQFVVNGATLTYETAPGFQITLQMTAIDIAATERANNEPPGSLMRRAQLTPQSAQQPDEEITAQTARGTEARKTITNRELQAAMQRRRESEVAYENRRKQLGLPSVADSRKQAAVDSELMAVELEQRRVAKGESEAYWRERATALRTEIAVLDAEIAWIGSQLDEGAFPSNGLGNASISTVTSIDPFGTFGNLGRRSSRTYGDGRLNRRGMDGRGVFVGPGQNTRTRDRGRFGRGARRGRGPLDGFIYARPGYGGQFPTYPGVGIINPTEPAYDYSYERSALITQFNELAAERAGMNARWRQLEEEARRAGAQPGWLRP